MHNMLYYIIDYLFLLNLIVINFFNYQFWHKVSKLQVIYNIIIVFIYLLFIIIILSDIKVSSNMR